LRFKKFFFSVSPFVSASGSSANPELSLDDLPVDLRGARVLWLTRTSTGIHFAVDTCRAVRIEPRLIRVYIAVSGPTVPIHVSIAEYGIHSTPGRDAPLRRTSGLVVRGEVTLHALSK
jgi:hypothetical protein